MPVDRISRLNPLQLAPGAALQHGHDKVGRHVAKTLNAINVLAEQIEAQALERRYA